MEKKCFIITPIGKEISDVRRATDGLIKSVFEPILIGLQYEVLASHTIPEVGSIINQIITHLLNDDLVIANLTTLNPNVLYELAVRHASMKHVIIIAEENTAIPFDISNERIIFYKDDIKGVDELKMKLSQSIQSFQNSEKMIDNPIYRVVQQVKIIKELNIKDGDVNDYILKRLDQIESKISNINLIKLLPKRIEGLKLEISVKGEIERVKKAVSDLSEKYTIIRKNIILQDELYYVDIISQEYFTRSQLLEVLNNNNLELVKVIYGNAIILKVEYNNIN